MRFKLILEGCECGLADFCRAERISLDSRRTLYLHMTITLIHGQRYSYLKSAEYSV